MARSVAAGTATAPPLGPPLQHQTSWIGNTFGGVDQKWVQDSVSHIRVWNDGTVYTSTTWDEAGRCTGAYKDGDVDPVNFRQYDGAGGHTAWGYGTAGNAVAVNQKYVFIGNTSGELVRFNRVTHHYVDTTKVGKLQSLSANDRLLVALAEDDTVTVRRAGDLSQISTFAASAAIDLVLAADDSLWVLKHDSAIHVKLDGTALAQTITGLAKPSSIDIDHRGRIIICDNGPEQVLFFDVATTEPKLAATFGDAGGITSGKPGEMSPTKLFNLVGAATDAAGNLYVAMSGGAWDGTILRAFSSQNHLRWELIGRQFLDLAVVDPANDGADVYSDTEHFRMLDSAAPGRDSKLEGYTVNAADADDPRPKDNSLHPAFARRVGSDHRLLLYMTRMTPGLVEVFGFKSGSEIASLASELKQQNEHDWGFYADRDGDIWEAGDRKIYHVPFTGFSAAGTAQFGKADEVATPELFREVDRIEYIKETDTMYLSGYTPNQPEETWGLVGKELARFDHWSTGNRTPAWSIPLPHDFNPKVGPKVIMKSLDIAGDYVFIVGVATNTTVWVYRASDGGLVGLLKPGPAISVEDGDTGWVDMPAAISAFRRSDGQYMIFVEEDRKNKTVLYRWKPLN